MTLYIAMQIAIEAHKNQKREDGTTPYIFHLFRVMMKMKTEEEMIVAVLHDVIEDTNITEEDLKVKGFSKQIIDALKLLTHPNHEHYMDYIKRISSNSLATQIKLADLSDNINHLEELGNMTVRKFARLQTYSRATDFLYKRIHRQQDSAKLIQLNLFWLGLKDGISGINHYQISWPPEYSEGYNLGTELFTKSIDDFRKKIDFPLTSEVEQVEDCQRNIK